MLPSKLKLTTILMIIAPLALLSCKSTATGPSFTAQELVGNWTIQSLHTKGTMSTGGITITIDTLMQLTDNSNYFRFYQDYTYSMKFDDASLGKKTGSRPILRKRMEGIIDTGTWTLSSNDLALQSNADNSTTMAKVNINNNTIQITIPLKVSDNGNSVDIVDTFSAKKE